MGLYLALSIENNIETYYHLLILIKESFSLPS